MDLGTQPELWTKEVRKERYHFDQTWKDKKLNNFSNGISSARYKERVT